MAKGQVYKPFSDWTQERKENHIKYDQQNYSVVGAKLTREKADQFRSLCKASSISVSAALSVFVRACLQADSMDVIRDDIPGRENADQENETPGTVGNPENASD